MVLIQKLNQYKETSGLTNQQIADKSGVPVGTVNRIMAGQTEEPSFSTIAKIVKATGGSLDEIIGIEPKTVTITETKITDADGVESVVYNIDFTGKSAEEINVITEYLKYEEYLAKWNGELPSVVTGDSATIMIPTPDVK